MAKRSRTPVDPAKKQNEKVVKSREKLAQSAAGVFAPTLRTYKNSLPDPLPSDPHELLRALLNNLTDPFFRSYPETLKSIRARFERQWRGRADAADKVASSVANSKKRSAGTNFQSLVSYALARYLLATESAWHVAFPVPQDFTESLAITFTAGIPPQGDELAPPLSPEEEEVIVEATGEDEPEDESAAPGSVVEGSQAVATVNPDVDLLLRNANWVPTPGKREPVVVLSVKTSIIDRGGSAARWKMYFDLANDPCNLAYDQRCVCTVNSASR